MWGELLRIKLGGLLPARPEPEVPGPDICATVPPRPAKLVADVIRWAGGDPEAWQGALPFYLHPQWGFPAVVATLRGLPYPMGRALNVGCTATMSGPIPIGQPLELRARLEAVDANERRVLLHQRLVTGTRELAEALVVDYQVLVPLPRAKGAPRSSKPDRPVVPEDSREVARWPNEANAGLQFALLTGDFNPIHWIGSAARLAGFKAQILHGFGSAARTSEALIRHVCQGDPHALSQVSMRFTSPLVLPSEAALFLGDEGSFTVGLSPGGPAFFVGSFLGS
jgi:acyl dehydratase